MNQTHHPGHRFLQILEQELNPPQREAVTYDQGPLLVLAGAGSGKTRVITYRIAYLILIKKLAPWNILAVTFTNKAAKEMRERIFSLVAGKARGLWIGTFHSLCARILRQDGKTAGIDPTFSIYDRSDQMTQVKQAMSKCNLGEKKNLKPATVLHEISQAKNKFLWPKQYKEKVSDDHEEKIAQIYQAYQDLLRQQNALDFDDLIMQAVSLLMQYPAVGDVYRQRFHHLLVDEYQDTNHPQYLFLKTLTQTHHNICVVGDDDQSIYRWRGADIHNILHYEKDYPETHVVRLEQNYRSTRSILEAAYHVIKNNRNRHEKKLWTDNEPGQKVKVVTLPDEQAEACWILDVIQKLHEQENIPFRDFTIFYRVNAQSRQFEEECIHRGIPYTIIGATAFYERKEVKDLLAYARLLINPADQASFDRIINVPRRKLGKVSVQKLYDFASQAKLPILEAAWKVQETGKESGLSPATQKAFHRFAAFFQRWNQAAAGLKLDALLDRIIKDSGYFNRLDSSKDAQDQTRLENLMELMNAARQFEEHMIRETGAPPNALVSLQGFLENSALISDVDSLNESDDAIVMMTVHSAKGLEFPYVFMAGMEEELFPHKRSLDSGRIEDVEEERRLCYVGLTRAKKQLYLTNACTRRLYNFSDMMFPSRFIDEIPEPYIEYVEVNGYSEEEDSPADTFTLDSSVIESFTSGDTVAHRTFGIGVVLDVKGQGEDAYLTVDFQQVGSKTLVQKYAHLVKV